VRFGADRPGSALVSRQTESDPHTFAPDRGKPGSGVIETVRGRLSVNQRSRRHVSGTRLDDAVGAR
jgi:hypothetical protein